MKRVLLRGARQLVTLRGPSGPRRGAALRELAIIQDGALLIEDGLISAVGPTRRLENLTEAREATEIEASGRVVIPGFVDSHTYLICGPPRLNDYEMRIDGASGEETAASGSGVPTGLEAIRTLPASRLRHQARRSLEAFFRHGTTTVEARTGYGLDETGELKALRVMASFRDTPAEIVPTFEGAHAVPPEYAGRAEDYLDWLVASMLPRIARRRLARFAGIRCGEPGFPVDQARRYLAAARAAGFGLKIRSGEDAPDGGARLAVELGAVSVDHLAHAGTEEVELLAGSPTVATLLPGSVFHRRGATYPPARLLIDRGAAVALATGFDPDCSPTYSTPMVLALACSAMRMTPAEAVSAATINGAHAVGMAARVGSIEYGKQADLVLLNASDYRELPYRFGSNLVHMTVKRGEVVYTEGDVQWPTD